MTHNNFDIDSGRGALARRPDKGVGKMNLEYAAGAWIKVRESGARLGIHHMLTLTCQTNFATYNLSGWRVNVYNVKNGGFLRQPGEYWTDQRAQHVFENLLRYVVALG